MDEKLRKQDIHRQIAPRRNLLVLLLTVILMITLASLYLYHTVSDLLVDINISSTQELAAHDTNTIMNTLNERWNDMSAAIDDIRFQEYESFEEMLSMLAIGNDFVDCKILALTGDDGRVYRSSGAIGLESDCSLYEEVMKHDDKFAMRFDYTSSSYEANKEYILIGLPIVPFSIEGVSFDHVFALAPITSIEDDLSIDSYGGEGTSYIINSDGYYVVNSSRSSNFTIRENFFDNLEGCRITGAASAAAIKNDIAQGVSSMSFELETDGAGYIVNIQKMSYSSWYYISYVPDSVFREQANRILAAFGIVAFIMISAVLAAMLFIINTQKKKVKMATIHRDELAEAFELAQQANRAKTTFLNSMSHDIRTPMNAIIGFTTLAATHAEEPDAVRGYLAKVTHSSEHLLSLINEVLDMSRIESGQLNISYKEENLSDLLDSLYDMFQNDISARQLSFSMDTGDVDAAGSSIICDRLRLNQVLLNVISNAVKYTPDGGAVSLRVVRTEARQDGYIGYEFHVKDNGIGMSPEFLERIFEPFTREETATVNGIQGTGLGMAITYRVVSLMEGTIDIKSEPGTGTEVTVALEFQLAPADPASAMSPDQSETRADKTPLSSDADDAPAASEASENTDQTFTHHEKRILIAEDNELNREIAVELLSEAGFAAETAENGQICIDMLNAADAGYYDLILMDIQMPVMNGYTAARSIRELPDPVKAHIPILALSANAFEEDIKASIAAGMDGHVSKPINVDVLMHKLHEVFSNSKLS